MILYKVTYRKYKKRKKTRSQWDVEILMAHADYFILFYALNVYKCEREPLRLVAPLLIINENGKNCVVPHYFLQAYNI